MNKVSNGRNFQREVKILRAPFDMYKYDCKNVISNSDAFKLRIALLSMHYKKKSCDLYSFHQSPDFYRISNSLKPKELQRFLVILSQIKQSIATFLGKKFNKTISVSCSKYNRGDYLLCHDDCVDDRSVAFIYYLNYDWLVEWGGTLDVYSVDESYNALKIEQHIKPEFNTIFFFPVGKHTYHQVAENVSAFSRISINGWFHCDDLSWEINHKQEEILPPLSLAVGLSRNKTASMCINSIFEDPSFKESVKEEFASNGFIMWEGFFKRNMVDMLSNELFSNDLKWQIKGPLNKRHYKLLHVDDLPFKVLFIVNMLKTDFMFNFLKECTGLDLTGVSIEVQRWHGGHYMVSGENNRLDHYNVLSVYLFFSRCFGQMSDNISEDLHYVFVERDTLIPKFACKPQDNTIFLVKRDANIESYVKYCKKVDGHAWTVISADYLISRNLTDPVVLVSKINEP